MLIFLLEAALRSLLMALAVWAVIRALRIRAVVAQKVAWVLVLAAAAVMPLVMHSQWLALDRAISIPLQSISSAAWFSGTAKSPAAQPSPALPVAQMDLRVARPPVSSKPSAIPGRRYVARAVRGPQQLPSRVEFSVEHHAALAPPAVQPYWTAARIRVCLWIAYSVIAAFLLLRAVIGLALAFRVWRRAQPVLFGSPYGEITVRVSPDLTTPVTIGSTIVLPSGWSDWDRAKLRVVLAHEQSHVHQGDFYLQLAAALHAAIFWFSPLGWWLKRILTELGEALGDRAGLAEAPDAAAYAQVLLEFAAMPRQKAHFIPWRNPIVGVSMARTSNLSGRIERILNDRRFRLAFLGGRRHAILAAALVPVALLAVVGFVRITPAVQAAQAVVGGPLTGTMTGSVTGKNSEKEPIRGQIAGQVTGRVDAKVTDHINLVDAEEPSGPILVQVAPPPVFNTPLPPDLAPPTVQAPEPPEQAEAQSADAPHEPGRKHGSRFYIHSGDDDGDNFAIVHENGDGTVHWSGEYNDELARIRKKMNLHGDYIWVQHDGKSYIITDPAILAQAREMFKPDPRLETMKKQLQAQQAVLDRQMADMNAKMNSQDFETPEFKARMAKLNRDLSELQGEKMRKLTADMNERMKALTADLNEKLKANLTDEKREEMLADRLEKLSELRSERMEKLGDLQGEIGEVQGKIGELQGELGEKQGEWGEKQGELGEKMGALGEKMGEIGEREGEHAEEASSKLKAILDQAVRDGKARPVD